MSVKIFHNPRCSKSRDTLNLIKDKGIEPEIIDYLGVPPTAEELKNILALLGFKSARDLMRKKETLYKAFNLDNPKLSEEELLEALTKNPSLIERPIVIKDEQQAVISRPAETVLEIL